MANEEHVQILRQGADAWNEWRKENLGRNVDDTTAEFPSDYAKLATVQDVKVIVPEHTKADLSGANLSGTNLMRADLAGANLSEADLSRANLGGVGLFAADLGGANLSEARLIRTDLCNANLTEARVSGALFLETILCNVDLSAVRGTDSSVHWGPSCVDHRTLVRSENVPVKFWQGCGLPDALIEYMPSLTGDAVQFYSCFISYSSKDQEFVDQLHADLQEKGVRCWFAPHDLEIGKNILDGIDEAIRLREKVVLILSEDAINSDWVKDEVTTAFEEERWRKETMLFPIRLDDAVLQAVEPWANKLRARNIGDFTRWKEHDAYKAAFERVLRDLRAGS